MPRIDITEHIRVLGDFYDRNFSSWRTFTTFSINADYEAIEKKAFLKTQTWYRDFSQNDPKTYSRSTCNSGSGEDAVV
jgi:hypothetical protein